MVEQAPREKAKKQWELESLILKLEETFVKDITAKIPDLKQKQDIGHARNGKIINYAIKKYKTTKRVFWKLEIIYFI